MKIVIVVTPKTKYPKRVKRMLLNNGHTVVDVSHILIGIKEDPDGMIIVANGPSMHVPFLSDLAGVKFPVLWIYFPVVDSCPYHCSYISGFISRTSRLFMSEVMAFVNTVPSVKEKALI